MKTIFSFLFIILLITGCEKDTVSSQPEKLITANQWKLDRFTDENGKTLANSQLTTEAMYIFALNFEFRTDNQVKAYEQTTKKFVNGGSWSFNTDKSAVKIDIPKLVGDFKLIQLTQNKLILQAENNILTGVGKLVNLELIPSL